MSDISKQKEKNILLERADIQNFFKGEGWERRIERSRVSLVAKGLGFQRYCPGSIPSSAT